MQCNQKKFTNHKSVLKSLTILGGAQIILEEFSLAMPIDLLYQEVNKIGTFYECNQMKLTNHNNSEIEYISWLYYRTTSQKTNFDEN